MQGTLLWLSLASLTFSSQNSQALSPRTEKVMSLYYARPQVKDCEKFNLSVNLIPEKANGDTDVYMLRIEVLYKDKDQDATMSILDIGLPTGFVADNRDLDVLSAGRVNYRVVSGIHVGSIIIHLDKVSHVQPEEIAFRITQVMKVGIMQPAAVSVHEYYNQKPCLRFYHPEKAQAQLLQLCQKDVCTCADVSCCKQKNKDTVSNDQRIAMACEIETNNKVDYVYKVRVESATEDDLSVDIYQMRIEDTLKEGTDHLGAARQLRAFVSPPHCRESLGLQKDKTYLIMGLEQDVHGNSDNQGYQYVLGEKTWIEYWPSSLECQSDEYLPVCLGMDELVNQLNIFGCVD